MNMGMSSGGWLPNNKRDETSAERADRNFVELLQEFRVAQQGVQVLFAFLLPVPFAPVFDELSQLQEWVYLVALLAAALGSILFIAPVSIHRFLFRMGVKDQIVKLASRLALCGLLMLAVSMLASVFVVTSFVFGYIIAWVAFGLGLISVVVFWYWIPVWLKKQINENLIPDPEEGD